MEINGKETISDPWELAERSKCEREGLFCKEKRLGK